jgi:hypothetical protein
MNKLRILAFLMMTALWIGCASGGGGEAASGDTAAKSSKGALPAGYSEPPAGSDLAKVQVGWNDAEVRKSLGDPDNANAYMTGKAWIPFYYGGDTYRTDWMYKGKGRVVFSRNQWSGALKVIRVMHNPNELM